MIDQVFAYWRFPWWIWAIAIGTLVGYLGGVMSRYIDD